MTRRWNLAEPMKERVIAKQDEVKAKQDEVNAKQGEVTNKGQELQLYLAKRRRSQPRGRG